MKTLKPRSPKPRTEAADLPRMARSLTLFLAGLAAAMLVLFVVLRWLAFQQGHSLHWVVSLFWLLVFVAWPGGQALRAWRRYRQARLLDETHILLPGRVAGFFDETTSAPNTGISHEVYWIIFSIDDGHLVGQKVGLAAYQRLNVGDSLTVRAFPERERRLYRAILDGEE